MGGGKSPKTSQVFRSEMGREFVFSVISQPGMKERGGFFYFFSFSNRHELFIHLFIYRSIIPADEFRPGFLISADESYLCRSCGLIKPSKPAGNPGQARQLASPDFQEKHLLVPWKGSLL
jgi:hypothetical protein